jgi:hypothetical protein
MKHDGDNREGCSICWEMWCLGCGPAKADRSPKGRDLLGSVHESGGPEGICPNNPSSQESR